MDVVEPVGDAGGVVEVLHGGFAVGAGLDLDHVNRGAGGAVVDAGALHVHVMRRVAAVEGQRLRGHRQRGLDHRRRKPQPVVGAGHGARAPASRRGPTPGRRRSRWSPAPRWRLRGSAAGRRPSGAGSCRPPCPDAPGAGRWHSGAARSAWRAARPPARREVSSGHAGLRLTGQGAGQARAGPPRAAKPRSAPMVRTVSAISQPYPSIAASVSTEARAVARRQTVPNPPPGASFSGAHHLPEAPPPDETPPPKLPPEEPPPLLEFVVRHHRQGSVHGLAPAAGGTGGGDPGQPGTGGSPATAPRDCGQGCAGRRTGRRGSASTAPRRPAGDEHPATPAEDRGEDADTGKPPLSLSPVATGRGGAAGCGSGGRPSVNGARCG